MLTEIPCFSPALIARSGQCFRMTEGAGGEVRALAGDRRVRVKPRGNGRFDWDCDAVEFDTFWRGYFDLDEDYAAIERDAMRRDAPLCRAAQACTGLRILRQEPWETLISFLLSQRKSIPAIRGCVEALCRAYGEPMGYGRGRWYAFPTPEALLGAGEKGLRDCGVGYRAPYLMDAARREATRGELQALHALDDEALLSALMGFHGAGVKVANCVRLFGYHRLSSVPIDVWIQRVIDEWYGGVSPFAAYGEWAGVYQQYLFLTRLDERTQKSCKDD